MWITIKTATTTDVLDAEEKNAVIKGLRLLLEACDEEERPVVSRLLHTLVPPPKESQKKHTI
jgi:hypothetical protein